MKKPQPGDLRLAAEWLDEYEGEPDTDGAQGLGSVAEWLRATALRAERDEFVRLAVQQGATKAAALQVWNRLQTLPERGR